jgi:NAD(P)-dependent dehydrogenase (short-subunit alcohol dehydrogenase family)
VPIRLSSWRIVWLSAEGFDPTEFAGKRVLVSGGTKGLGRATVTRFLAAGARVITAARGTQEPIEGVEFVQADLTTVEGGEMLAQAALDRLGGIDILAHVVGGSAAPGGGFAALTDDHWLAELNLNLLATVRLDRLLIPQMIERGTGAVVHVTSIQSVLPLPESTTAYAAAKGALRTYSKSVSRELGPKGVRVNVVSPGWIMTESSGEFLRRLQAANGGTIEDARQLVLDSLSGIPSGAPPIRMKLPTSSPTWPRIAPLRYTAPSS